MHSLNHFKVANKDESRDKVLSVLNNTEGPARDIVLINAGLAIYAGNQADSIAQGIEKARELVSNGAALAKLHQFAEYTRKFI